MSLLFDPQVVAALLTVGLTVAAGAIGFFIRERLAQAKPFISTLRIEGENLVSGKNVDVPAAVVQSLNSVPVLSSIDSTEPLRTVAQVLSEVEYFRDEGPELLQHLQALRTAIANGERGSTEEALARIINSSIYDLWLTNLFGDGEVPIPDDDATASALIPYSYEPEFKNGSFSIRLSGSAILFGSQLNKFKMYRSNIERLLPLVSKLEFSKLLKVFEQVEEHIRRCVNASKDAAPILQEIINQNSQWTVRLFVANLGRAPFLVEPTATLEVRDTTGAVYSEICSLFAIEKTSNGEETSQRTEVPLIVRSQSDAVIGFITTKTQAEMDRGGAFREVYKSGKATCQVQFSVQQTGLSTTAVFHSPKVPFERRV
jgi:hypothetical protein